MSSGAPISTMSLLSFIAFEGDIVEKGGNESNHLLFLCGFSSQQGSALQDIVAKPAILRLITWINIEIRGVSALHKALH